MGFKIHAKAVTIGFIVGFAVSLARHALPHVVRELGRRGGLKTWRNIALFRSGRYPSYPQNDLGGGRYGALPRPSALDQIGHQPVTRHFNLSASQCLKVCLGFAEPLIHRGPPFNGDPLHIASLAIGFLSTLLCAHLTARLSATVKFANVVVFWAINEVLGLLSLLVTTFPLWYNIAGTFVVLTASVLGWYSLRSSK
jgi:hypothetical protein